MAYNIRHALMFLILVLYFINSEGASKNKAVPPTYPGVCSVCFGVNCSMSACKGWESCR